MKKKPNYKAEKYMIVIAIALLAIAAVGIIFLAVDATGVFDNIGKENETSAAETTVPTAVVQHDDVETETNADGTPKKVIYYKDNVYNGSIDYVYEGDTIYEVHFDENDVLLKSIKKQINEIGSVIYESYSSASEVLREIEYTYYDDLATVWKRTTTEHEDEKKIVTKELFTEEGKLTDKYVYEDSVEVSHIVYTYDENGEILKEEEMAA